MLILQFHFIKFIPRHIKFTSNIILFISYLLFIGIPFIETSALTGSNIENGFVSMTSKIKSSVDSRGLSGIKNGKILKQAGGVEVTAGDKKTNSCLCT